MFQQLFNCTMSDVNLFFPLYTLFLAISIAACESQCKETSKLIFPTMAHLPKGFLATRLLALTTQEQ